MFRLLNNLVCAFEPQFAHCFRGRHKRIWSTRKPILTSICASANTTADDQTIGRWRGFGAERLGLRNAVQRDDFLQLCQNLNPVTGERLTQRHKTTRLDSGHEVANRRIFYDFTFSPPKSVSLLALVAHDQRLIEAHDRAVVSALAELEQFAATRVHEAGQISEPR